MDAQHILIGAAVAYVLGFTWLGAYVATQKGREPLEGALLGLFFSGIGVLVVAMLPTNPTPKARPSQGE